MEKIGRNDPCHCGSGIKYKKCCLKIDSDKVMATQVTEDDFLEEKDSFEDRLSFAKFKKIIERCLNKAEFFSAGDEDEEYDDGSVMPDVIMEFAGELLNQVEGHQATANLLSFVCFAWNQAIVGEHVEANTFIREVSGVDSEMEEKCSEILSWLVQRKLQHYAGIKRLILDYSYEIDDAGDEFNISINSIEYGLFLELDLIGVRP